MSDRLRLAVENGHVVLPDGGIWVLEPREESDLSIFRRDRTSFLVRRASMQNVLKQGGWSFEPPTQEWNAAVVFLPRAKDAQRAIIRLAREATDGPIIIDGSKTDGIETIYRDLKKLAEVSEAWSKSHGKVFTVTGGTFDAWPEFGVFKGEDGWWRAPGVFSADGVDPASQLLADTLADNLSGTVVDLGSGWGYLADAVLKSENVAHIDMIEDDVLAERAAQNNIQDKRASFHLADALTWSPDAPVDHVITNPPFHTGRAADPTLGQGFIRTAARILKRNGTLWLVANRQLPYESTLEETFRDVHLLKETAQFKLYRAERPRARRKG